MFTIRKSGTSIMVAALWLCASGSLAAQTFTTLFSFNFTDGNLPIGGLVQATDGNFYGTTATGGLNRCKVHRTHSDPNGVNNGCGTIFKITPRGALTSLHTFDGTDGEYPESGVVQGVDGNFYGTTQAGGTDTSCDYGLIPGCGTIFKITPSGTFTTLHSFQLTDGAIPARKLVQGTDGNFYGATGAGGANGYGTVFKITPSGTLTTLHSFDGTDGADPLTGLVQGTDGNFYGTTDNTVFKITPSGTLTTLHTFDGTDGSGPNALVQGTNGNLYGTTIEGGTGGNAENAPSGTVFEITPSGTITTLFNFDNLNNQNPGGPQVGALVQGTGTDGNFYGLTVEGGSGVGCGTAGCGTLFKMTPSGTLTVVYSIPGPTANGIPDAGLIQSTNGNFYGATSGGGLDYGTIYSLSVGLGPFVETQTASGAVGATVNILGTDLTGATSVSFNGTAAAFTVVSSSEITTTVPSGATTGEVQVVTPSGTLLSNVSFRVP
jgi:uncharacterized repeat protein (TIGR03803 family)